MKYFNFTKCGILRHDLVSFPLLHTHLKLLYSPLQAFCVQVGFFSRQLLLCHLQPPEEGAGKRAELHQLLVTTLDGIQSVDMLNNEIRQFN